jgi:iron complex transport system substrate-binding protein
MTLLRLLAVALTALLTLTACGDGVATDGAATDPAAAPESDTATAAADEAATRTVTHAGGTTEIPADPQRIVTLQDQNGLLPLLELGVRPVASAALQLEGGGQRFRRVDGYDTSDIEPVGDYGEPDLEAIAAQRPDLIVGTEFHVEYDAQLSAIAPTVYVQIFERPLPEALAEFAALVGAEDRHAELRAEYEAAIADLIADLPRAPEDISVSWVEFGEPGQFYLPNGQAVGTVLADVGFARPETEAQATAAGTYDERSFESITDHEADIMISGDFGADDGSGEEPGIVAARAAPLFQALDVVQRGEYHVYDGNAMVGAAYEKMLAFTGFLREVFVEREPTLRAG